MKRLLNNLKIGEKISLGFGLVGLIFLLVIWSYHSTLKQTLADYKDLNDHFVIKKELLNDIESRLIKARQFEKNFLLKPRQEYSNKLGEQIQSSLLVSDQLSKIDSSAKKAAQQFNNILKNYQKQFSLVNDAWVKKGLDENSGLQGSFRQAVHALEEEVTRLNNDKILVNILQLRRREKDYLLRDDKIYVQMVLNIIQTINHQLESANLSAKDKTNFMGLLYNYQHDFLALVEQNMYIAASVDKMEKVASNLSLLVNKNIISHNAAMKKISEQIMASSDERINLMYWLVIFALILGAYFAFIITSRIVSPVKKMSAILEKLTYSEHIEVMPYQTEGRDEINAMAGSLNILSEHRKRFIQWWKNAMKEAETTSKLEQILKQLSKNKSDEITVYELQEIKSELEEILAEKKQLTSNEFIQIIQHNDEILNKARHIDHPSLPRDELYKTASSIYYKANLIKKSLELLSSKS